MLFIASFVKFCIITRKLSDGLFLKECEKVAELYPGIEFNSMIIDNCCMQVSCYENSTLLYSIYFNSFCLSLDGVQP